MTKETLVVMLFLTVRVCLVGGIFLAYPRITRKGLVFGTYVGESVAEGEEARRIKREWDRGIVMVMVLSLAVGYGISMVGRPVTGNLTGTVVLLGSLPFLYVWVYSQARRLAPPSAARQAEISAAPLSVNDRLGEGLGIFALVVCILTGLAVIAYATIRYGSLPDSVPTLANLFGINEELRDKSLIAILLMPLLSLVVCSGFALMAILIARAKSSVRAGLGGRSVEAQKSFRVLMSQLLSGMALFTCLFASLVSVKIVHAALSPPPFLHLSIGLAAGAMVLFALLSLFQIMTGSGQGGALLEKGSPEAPLTGALADNAHWYLGMMYIDKDDPSILVESRFGLGYTVNYGNRNALLVTIVYAALLLGLLALALVDTLA